MTDVVFDPLEGERWVLDGRIEPMTGPGDGIPSGRIYIDGGRIAAVQPASTPPPPEFRGLRPLKTGGTIFPGLIELHNHLAYNVLPLWNVPKRWDNRGQWPRHSDYRKLISGPMRIVGETDGLIQAAVRWVEAKCLVAGVTTSQGVALYSRAGAKTFYRGLVRNVEETNDDLMPEAATKIGDVEAKSAAKFRARLRTLADGEKKLILHLAEGVDKAANEHFRALKIENSNHWAITEALIGIHATGLKHRNFRTLAVRGGSIVWSPLSNLLLYGDTTDVGRARRDGVKVALGSDWSPSGSKNLLMELKVARLWCDHAVPGVSDFDIVSMATRNPAEMLGWASELGTIEAGKRADFMVIDDKHADACGRLIDARETSIVLVVINGIRRCGQRRLMAGLDDLESTTVRQLRGATRWFNLRQEHVDPIVAGLSLHDAEDTLTTALASLPQLAADRDAGLTSSITLTGGTLDLSVGAGISADLVGDRGGPWFLELDHLDSPDRNQRPMTDDDRGIEDLRTGRFEPSDAAGVPLAELLEPIELDRLTATADNRFWTTLASETNLPVHVRDGLFRFYRRRVGPALDAAEPPSAAHLETVSEDQGPLSLEERKLVVQQAEVLLGQSYVHLPFKQSRHAVDPVQALRLLANRLDRHEGALTDSDFDFHNELTTIFNSVRDLHTNYLLPDPYRRYTAALPFLIEEYFDEGEDGSPHYVVTRVASELEHPTFRPGVELTHWNGVPIPRAIARNADLQAGGNPAAARARGLEALTIRPLIVCPPPDEEWVIVRYVDEHGQHHQVRHDWKLYPAGTDVLGGTINAATLAVGLDLQTHATNETRRYLYARSSEDRAERAASAASAADESNVPIETTLDHVFRAYPLAGDRYGYIRIFTFAEDPDPFVDEFERLLGKLPGEGLIIDVRGNGGGNIHAAERTLQMLTPNPIRPERAQLAASRTMLDICERHAPSTQFAGFDLSPWIDSLQQAETIGSDYTWGYPITPPEAANDRGQKYSGPVVLIVDARSYSATDIFAAGFVDHEIGKVLGVHENMGAGGANVWRHSDLLALAGGPDGGGPFERLPRNIDMRASVRRLIRVGAAEGQPLEDLGIQPDAVHRLSRKDLFEGNRELIAAAVELL